MNFLKNIFGRNTKDEKPRIKSNDPPGNHLNKSKNHNHLSFKK